MLDNASSRIQDPDATGPAADEAQGIYQALIRELRSDSQGPCSPQWKTRASSQSTPSCAASAARLCATVIIWARPSSTITAALCNGFNNYSGASGYASAGRFLIYARGEFQGAPSANRLFRCAHTVAGHA
jgi:hypothetical protein